MRVLGISPLDKDATVSFLEDGRVVFACAEERLSRVKLQSGFPHRALRLGLEKTGWDASADHYAWNRELVDGLAEYGLAGKLRRFHHHDTHAANAFFASGYDRALLVTLDGYGSGCCGGVYIGDREGVRMLHRFSFPNS